MALHFDPVQAMRELEAEGFEHRQAAAIVNLIRDRVLAHTSARDEDADSTIAAITQTERALRSDIAEVKAEVVRLDAKIGRLDAKVDAAVRDLTHKIELGSRDAAEKAGARAEAAAGRTNMWIGFASAFLGLMIAASALLPAVVALFK